MSSPSVRTKSGGGACPQSANRSNLTMPYMRRKPRPFPLITPQELDAMLRDLPAQLNDRTTTPEFKCAALAAALATALTELRQWRGAQEPEQL